MAGLTIQGAYGRDYTSGREMALALLSGKDFKGTNPALGLLGVTFSIRDLDSMKVDRLSLRFNKDRSVIHARYESGGIRLKNDEGEWIDVRTENPEANAQGSYCPGCGGSGGSCAGLSCVELHYDSVVEAYCPSCGDCREVEPDARGYACFNTGCSGKITSPFELMM